jgi:hypothetical protein
MRTILHFALVSVLALELVVQLLTEEKTIDVTNRTVILEDLLLELGLLNDRHPPSH